MNLTLYAIADRASCRNMEAQVHDAIRGGITMLQYRDKSSGDEEFTRNASALKAIADRLGIPLVINDRIETALRLGTGLHIGQDDIPAKDARAAIGERILGVSARTVRQAIDAESDGADYIGCGAVFGTSTKEDAERVSMETLKEICSSVSIPVAAIGGINESNVLRLQGTGISGVAVVSAIFGSADVYGSSKKMKALAASAVRPRDFG